MFRIDRGLTHHTIPTLPTGYPLALVPVIPSLSLGLNPSPPVRGESHSDEFRMYEFKVKRCPVSQAHEWTVCPWAHPGERARRRDPRRVPYKPVPCEEFRAHQHCPRGDACDYAHGVFEYWLHPARYRTRACTSGARCTRTVCFFAHAPGELRPRIRLPFEPKASSVRAPFESTCMSFTKNGSEGGNLMECEDDGFHDVPDVDWITDLIG